MKHCPNCGIPLTGMNSNPDDCLRKPPCPPETWYEHETIERYGVKVSAALFQYFSESANVGTTFRFDRTEDGVITVTRLEREVST